MNSRLRITSVIQANNLDVEGIGFNTFSLSKLKIESNPIFRLPTNVRLGHLIEVIVSKLIKSSSNYDVCYENIQLTENKKTIGEIDFIIQNADTKEVTHLELAYKFYLYDPRVSTEQISNWIGPNRKDSLKGKLEKLKRSQFPLLYHDRTASLLKSLVIEEISQALCLLATLFVPLECRTSFDPIYQKAIAGYYFNLETFINLDNTEKAYYVPSKMEWGMKPSENNNWNDLSTVEGLISQRIGEKQSVLCWQKQNEAFLTFFIVWW